jgi:hypothetical protein
MPTHYFTIWDLLLTPIFILFLSIIAVGQRNKRYPPGHPLRPYFMKGLMVKFFGAIFIGLVYQYYYHGGDTLYYHYHSKIINSAMSESFSTWFWVVTRQSHLDHPDVYKYAALLEWYPDPSSYTVAAVAAVFGLFCGTNYMPIAVIFAYVSFTGIWAMYRTFVNIYPKLHKELALAFLFIPSTFVWGSGLFKDTLCMFGLGWLTYTVFRVFVNRDYSFKNLLFMVLSFYLIYKIKIYILLAFVPALSLWLLATYSTRVSSAGLRFIVKTAFIALSIAGFLFFTRLFANELAKYNLENIAATAQTTRDWIAYSSGDEGSGYNLGEFDPSIVGMLTKFPQAVIVTLFRPFPWEARKVIVLLSALEALIFLYFTYKAFQKRGIFKSFQLIFNDPNLLFCFIFSIIFAFAVGISAYNFGTLSRYKIPCLPFYGAFLIILMNYQKISASSSLLGNHKKMPGKVEQRT